MPNLSTQLTISEILHSQLTVFIQLFRRRKAHKKYCTPGYAAVNHCRAHHLLLVKANGWCVHRSAEQHWSLSLGWFPLWIIDEKVQVKWYVGQKVETCIISRYLWFLCHIFKAISGRVISQRAQCEQCDISLSIMSVSPRLKDVTIKRI